MPIIYSYCWIALCDLGYFCVHLDACFCVYFVLFILLSVSQCILLCFRFRVYVCNVFVSSCLLSYFLCCIVPLCHFSASLCFCYPSFCWLYHFLIQYLLTFLLVLGNYFDFYFFIFVHIYTYYVMVGCMTCAGALLDLIVCACAFFGFVFI